MQILLTNEFIITFLIFTTAAAIVVLMRFLASRPRQSLTPSLVPTTPVALIAGGVAVFAMVHMLALLGLHN